MVSSLWWLKEKNHSFNLQKNREITNGILTFNAQRPNFRFVKDPHFCALYSHRRPRIPIVREDIILRTREGDNCTDRNSRILTWKQSLLQTSFSSCSGFQTWVGKAHVVDTEIAVDLDSVRLDERQGDGIVVKDVGAEHKRELHSLGIERHEHGERLARIHGDFQLRRLDLI